MEYNTITRHGIFEISHEQYSLPVIAFTPESRAIANLEDAPPNKLSTIIFLDGLRGFLDSKAEKMKNS